MTGHCRFVPNAPATFTLLSLMRTLAHRNYCPSELFDTVTVWAKGT